MVPVHFDYKPVQHQRKSAKKDFLSILNSRRRKNSTFVAAASPWPILMATAIASTFVAMALWLHYYKYALFFLYAEVVIFILVLSFWFKDLIIEAQYAGLYQIKTRKALRLGFLIFLASEAMFFFALFWAYFHFSLNPSVWIGATWPPYGFKTIPVVGLPLLNTIILVTSGVTLTYAQKALAAHRKHEGGRSAAIYGMQLTLGLAVMFIMVQWYEFAHCWFSINDSVYGSIFFFITGFHGIHVIIGTIFLSVMYVRILNYHFFREEQTALDMAAWYWHFVDVVWILVFLVVYCWGGK